MIKILLFTYIHPLEDFSLFLIILYGNNNEKKTLERESTVSRSPIDERKTDEQSGQRSPSWG